jgi:hypothetical protein
MSMDSDRRAPGATRIPFEALVEVSPSLGPSFEAQAVNVSDEGMHLRTAYLPEVGQPLLCRFDAGAAGEIHTQCEVLWRQEGDSGGEFGMRFVDLDPQSAEAIARIVHLSHEKMIQPPGAKVRLHIEGLGFPMKARVKDASRKELTVGNELGFLQVGKELELEDASTGEKRPARIDRVEVEIDPESKIPRLVVGLRYGDESESIRLELQPQKDSTPEPLVMDPEVEEEDLPKEDAYAAAPAKNEAHVDDEDDIAVESEKMKGTFAKNAAKVTPAILDFAKRARVTAGMLWEKRKQRGIERAGVQKRTTAPPPGGGLHASGRKVVRAADLVKPLKPRIDTKRKIIIGASAGLAVVLAFAAFHKSPSKTDAAKSATTDATALAAAPPPPAPIATTPVMPAETAPAPSPMADSDQPDHKNKHVHVAPFGNGGVAHGNVLKLKMDGTIEKINGAAEPTGFSVSIPGRRSLEPAGPLASRDNRIASIKVSNDPSGSELDVAFKDGVPSYLVRAKGDILEIVLASPGKIDGDDKGEKIAHKNKRTHDKK